MCTWLCMYTSSIVSVNNCICVPGFAWASVLLYPWITICGPGFAWISSIVYHSICRYIPVYHSEKVHQYCILSRNIGVPDSVINSKYVNTHGTLEYDNVSHFPRKSVVEPDHINKKGLHSLYNTLDKKILLSLNTKKVSNFYDFKWSFPSLQKLCRLREKLSINLLLIHIFDN